MRSSSQAKQKAPASSPRRRRAMKIDVPLLNVPQSMAAVSSQVIHEQSARNITDVLRNFSGITEANTFGNIGDNFMIRRLDGNCDLSDESRLRLAECSRRRGRPAVFDPVHGLLHQNHANLTIIPESATIDSYETAAFCIQDLVMIDDNWMLVSPSVTKPTRTSRRTEHPAPPTSRAPTAACRDGTSSTSHAPTSRSMSATRGPSLPTPRFPTNSPKVPSRQTRAAATRSASRAKYSPPAHYFGSLRHQEEQRPGDRGHRRRQYDHRGS